MTKLTRVAALGALTLLAACGTNPHERVVGGAETGALAGAGTGALAGPVGALAGAAIGGGVGAVTGATTSPKDLNLGRNPLSQPQARVPGPNGIVQPSTGDVTRHY